MEVLASESDSESVVVKEEEQQSGIEELLSEFETVRSPGIDAESEKDEVESDEESDPDTVTSGGRLESVDDVVESGMATRRGRLSELASVQSESSFGSPVSPRVSTTTDSGSSSLNSVSESDSYSKSASSGSVSS